MSETSVTSAKLPRKGKGFMRWLGRTGLKILGGWKVEGQLPETSKAIIAIAPHTSNWDFFVGLFVMFRLNLKLNFLAKHSLFVFPLKAILLKLGGLPIRRHQAEGVVEQMVKAFRQRDELILVITPEGTRKKVKAWKTGFLRIAQQAKVPVIPVAMDFARRTVDIMPPMMINEGIDNELERVQQCFSYAQGKNPENG